MSQWIAAVPKSNGLYFYRPGPGMTPAIVERTAAGFLFHGVERVVPPEDMVGEFWSDLVRPPQTGS